MSPKKIIKFNSSSMISKVLDEKELTVYLNTKSGKKIQLIDPN